MTRKICVVGLGYVGLPVAVAFGEKYEVVGFDINDHRISMLKQGYDLTHEITESELASVNIHFTTDASLIQECDFVIVAVPTPITDSKQPDLTPLIKASETVGRNLRQGAIVVYESTVYPGATEEDCVPVLERSSGLRCGVDFFVGYSPERINPGDKAHTFKNIKKVVSGQADVLDTIAETYGSVVSAGVYKADSIKVAEAAKVIENTQRDLNIALMNELAMIFGRLGIDTKEVIKAASTKWNFLPFFPGLVGGHCIGVDPYYLTHKAEKTGYHPQVILAGRRINDNMGAYIATSLIKQMIYRDISIQGSTVTILGLTFKENVPDLRNSKVIDVITELREFGIHVQVCDPFADKEEAAEEYGIDLIAVDQLRPASAVVLAVSHHEFVQQGWSLMRKLLNNGSGVVADVKGVLDKQSCPDSLTLWRL